MPIRSALRCQWPLFQRSNSKNEDWNWNFFCTAYSLCLSFQRSNSKNEDWNICWRCCFSEWESVSKVKLKKWGLKYKISCIHCWTSNWFQRSNSKNEDWNFHSSLVKLSISFVSKVKLKKWGLKFDWMSVVNCRTHVFQRSNSKNEDWNYSGWVMQRDSASSFKGQTQKMRIEILRFYLIVRQKSFVSKVKLKKWGLKYFINTLCYLIIVGFKGQTQKMRIEMIIRPADGSRPSCFKGQTQKMRIEIDYHHKHNSQYKKVSKVKLRKWGLKSELWIWI